MKISIFAIACKKLCLLLLSIVSIHNLYSLVASSSSSTDNEIISALCSFQSTIVFKQNRSLIVNIWQINQIIYDYKNTGEKLTIEKENCSRIMQSLRDFCHSRSRVTWCIMRRNNSFLKIIKITNNSLSLSNY